MAATVVAMPPAWYGVPAIRAANSALRSPANTRCACESTKPGSTARPPQSIRGPRRCPPGRAGPGHPACLDDQRRAGDRHANAPGPASSARVAAVVGDQFADSAAACSRRGAARIAGPAGHARLGAGEVQPGCPGHRVRFGGLGAALPEYPARRDVAGHAADMLLPPDSGLGSRTVNW